MPCAYPKFLCPNCYNHRSPHTRLADPKPARKKSASSPPAPEPAPPDPAPAAIDFSDILAETDVELRRLGWDAKRGREHLKATYSKRSRQELNETELYDFLEFLKAQPNP